MPQTNTSRIKQVLRSLCSKQLRVIRYPGGVIKYPKEKIETTDIKTRKLLTKREGFHFHPKCSTLRLYTKD